MLVTKKGKEEKKVSREYNTIAVSTQTNSQFTHTCTCSSVNPWCAHNKIITLCRIGAYYQENFKLHWFLDSWTSQVQLVQYAPSAIYEVKSIILNLYSKTVFYNLFIFQVAYARAQSCHMQTSRKFFSSWHLAISGCYIFASTPCQIQIIQENKKCL